MPAAGPKNRAFRCKSSELLMQFLWAFRFNPLRAHQRQFQRQLIAFDN
ncbi:MAG: hypothetical protein LBK44_06075 [Spirochaetales bacterium]|nr:hypothetical protein [Spirochaetales bacterium]